VSNRRQPRDPDPSKVWHTGLDDDTTTVLALLVAATTTCPDCNSEATVDRDGPLVNIRFAHDDGCPWLGGLTR